MLRLSTFPIKTLKTIPKVSDNKSTSFLLQAGFIRQTMAGVYTYTTLGLRVLEKIKKIVREEMNAYNAHEMLMPALSPRDVWDLTGRWDSIDVMFHVPATDNKEYALNSTHEEIVTPLMAEFIKSYKDLPLCVYQIQNKFRNEKRAKSGLLRGREFVMKDAYSFHADDTEFTSYYEGMKKVYMNVCRRLGLEKDTYIVKADGGTFTDKFSHEFQVKLDIGEDVIFYDRKSGECFNKEVTPSKCAIENISDSFFEERKDVEAPNIIGVDALVKMLGVPSHKTTKTMMFESENRFIVAAVRGDYDVNTLKLQKLLGVKYLNLASPERIKEITGADIGYSGIYNLPEGIEVYLDDSIEGLTNFETGTNKTGYHSVNVNFGRDLPIPHNFYDFKEAKQGDKNPSTGEVYEVFKASEVGNIFPLETKFSKAFGVNFLDKNNISQTPLMGCYGIGISRLMGVVAEYFSDETGIAWPESIAPANHYILVLGENNIDAALRLAQDLEKKGFEVILDDRFSGKIGFGQKMSDAELFGIPNIIIISDKTKEKDAYEIRKRGEKEGKMIHYIF